MIGTRPRLGLSLQNAFAASRNMGVPDPTVYGVPSFKSPEPTKPISWVGTPSDRPQPPSPPMDSPDYAALLTQALGVQKEPSTLQKIAGIVGPAILAATGHEGMAQNFLSAQQSRRNELERQRQEAALTAVKWRREDDREDAKRNEPRYFSGREDQVRYDPVTGASSVVYDAPRDFEDYAALAGEAGTPEYFNAAEDYVLRGNGPTAFQYDRDLETVRQAGRMSQEAARQRNRAALRGMPTYRDTHPSPRSTGGGGPSVVSVKSPAEAQGLAPGTRYKAPDGVIRIR